MEDWQWHLSFAAQEPITRADLLWQEGASRAACLIKSSIVWREYCSVECEADSVSISICPCWFGNELVVGGPSQGADEAGSLSMDEGLVEGTSSIIWSSIIIGAYDPETARFSVVLAIETWVAASVRDEFRLLKCRGTFRIVVSVAYRFDA